MTVNYKFKTIPYKHQQTALDKCGDNKCFGLFMEMGTGKSKVLIDNLGMLFCKGKVNFALIIAPKGVYRNWVEKEIPQHLSDSVPYRVIRWVSSANKKQTEEMRSVKDTFSGLTIFVMNVEAFSTLKGKNAGEWMAKNYGSHGMIVVDESTSIKNHKAKRTKSLIKIAESFDYTRILTGSPVTNSPLDIYAQTEFLRPGLLGFDSYWAFQARYAIMQNVKMGAHSFTQIKGYRNLDDLQWRLGKFSYRVLKKDCLDLPEKTFTSRYVTLSDKQYNWYQRIKREAMILLDNGDLVTAPAVITQMLRLQQILSGHIKTDDGDVVSIPTKRIEAVTDILDESSSKAIIWSRFRHDIVSITSELNKKYGIGSAAAYFGDTSDDERNRIVRDFQDPKSKLQYLIGNPSTAGYGLTLTEANLVIYYANDFNLATRMQSEDRAHRIGQNNPVTYVDLICEGTIDEKIVSALQAKIDISAKVLGEEVREWLNLKPTRS